MTVESLKFQLLALPVPFIGSTERFTEVQPEDVVLVPAAVRDEINARNQALKNNHELFGDLFPFV
jgi:hypothetical protein